MLKLLLMMLTMLLPFGDEVDVYQPITVDTVGQIQVITELYDAPEMLPEQEITDLEFSKNNSTLGFVTAQAQWVDGNIYFFDITTFEPIDLINDMKLNGTSLHFTNDWLLVGKQYGDVERYDLATEKLMSTTSGGVNGDIEVISTNANQEYLAVAATTEMRGEYIFYLARANGEALIQIPTGRVGRGYSTAFHPSADLVAIAMLEDYHEDLGIPRKENQSWISTVQLWDINNQELIGVCDDYHGNLGYVSNIIFRQDGEKLIYLATDGIRIWDLRDCREFSDTWTILEPLNPDDFVSDFALHPTEPILVVAYSARLKGRGFLRFWNIETGEMLHEISSYGTGEYNAIRKLAFSPDGTLLASGGQDGTVRLWGIPAGE